MTCEVCSGKTTDYKWTLFSNNFDGDIKFTDEIEVNIERCTLCNSWKYEGKRVNRHIWGMR